MRLYEKSENNPPSQCKSLIAVLNELAMITPASAIVDDAASYAPRMRYNKKCHGHLSLK
ncbi:MAG TPA: hypothetical protein VEM40_13335 [Nitrospirota bacterium]|nr:hypothetical protein [Nitrospirota bacterium]